MLVNTVYAFLAERYDADDRVSRPVFLSVGVEADTVEAMSARDALDVWLESPAGAEADNEAALLRFLTT